LRPITEAAGLHLDVEIPAAPAAILSDAGRFVQLLSNLVGNAVKFTAPGGSLRISAGVADGDVCFSVRDSGSGIPADDLPRLFDRFWQADRADQRGAGLGLSIAKAIVTAHEGAIGVTSTEGGGSSFYFDLPTA